MAGLGRDRGLGHDGGVDRATESGAAPARGPHPHAPAPDDPGPGAAGRVLGAGVLVALGVAAAALAGPWQPRTGPGTELPEPPPLSSAPETMSPDEEQLWQMLDRQGQQEPWDLTYVGLALLALVLGLVLLVVLRVLRRLAERRRGEGAPDDAGLDAGPLVAGGDVTPLLPALRDGVEDAGDRLRRVPLPGDAVIAAWVALENAAAGSGVVRRASQTPTEFTLAVLDRTPADPVAARELLDLYLRARFGDEPVGPRDVDVAADAVRRLADSLDPPPAGEATGPGGPRHGGPGTPSSDAPAGGS